MTAKNAKQRKLEAVLARHGRTFADEVGIDVTRNTPSTLFRLLCFSLLASARIRANVAVDASRALARRRWTTARAMAEASWEDRTHVLNQAGYARYDERTATMLGDTARLLLDRWDGDLLGLRDEAERRPQAERRLLKECKGIGDVGVDIFFREVQIVWDELRPFVDRRAVRAAGKLGLGASADEIARLVPEEKLPVLVAALIRVELAKDYDLGRK